MLIHEASIDIILVGLSAYMINMRKRFTPTSGLIKLNSTNINLTDSVQIFCQYISAFLLESGRV